MSLQNLNNGAGQDKWSDGYTKINACIDAVNQLGGGTTNQIPYKVNGTDFNIGWTDGGLSSGTITAATGWGSASTLKLNIGGWVEFNADLSITTGGTITVGTIATAYRPAINKRFVIADYNGTDGASSIMILNITTSGDITLSKQADGTKPANRTSLLFTINYNILS